MKHLNVRWVPETFAIVSLTVAASQQHAPWREPATAAAPADESASRGRLIVISGKTVLKADVTAVHRLPGRSVTA